MLDVSAAYTAAIKDKNRTDRITGAIKLCDGETINITDDIIVNNSVTLKEQLVSGDTFEIGTFYTNQLDITVYDNNFLSRTYANARITPKYEIQLADGTWESVPLGIFTVDNSLTKRKGSIHKLTAFDDSTKFDVDISVYSGGKKTVQQHIKDLAADVGITLVTTDFSSYPNYDLTVDSTVSSSVQTYRDLIEWCCALMASSARINRYGKLEIVKLKEKKKIVDGALVYDADYTVEGYERTGTEFFDLRALTKYFSTAFDGEPYVYKNHAVLTLPDAAARNATMFIPENPLLQSVSDAERKTAFETCVNTIYIALRRVEFSFNGNPAIECFDTLFGNGGKIDINGTIAFFPTSLVWKYRGAHKVSCAFAELTDEATASASEAAISVVNASTINKMPVQVKSKTEKRLDGVGKTAFDASSVGKFTTTGIGCEIFNDYENNIASSTYAHAEGNGTKATAPSTHAEGNSTTASSTYAHAEGYSTEASGEGSHAEGEKTTASGYCSHAEGYNAVASGGYSHAEGYNAVASGWYSHAGGINSEAKAEASFAHGMYAVSDYRGGAAFGISNKTKDALFVVGNGSPGGNYESDALVLDNAGNLWVAGSIKCGGDSGGYTLPPATADTLGGVMIGENINVSDSGTISVDLSEYLKSDAISDWAKAENKPAYTAQEVGAATVADITAAVNAVEIGGRNLLYDSTGNIKNGWSGNTIITVDGGISGNSLAISRTGYSGNARYFGTNKRHFLTDFNVGTSYTLSAWIKVRSDIELDASGYVMARFRSADDKKLYALSLTVSSQTEKDKWIYYEKTWTINDSDIAKLECVALALDKNGMIEACDIKLEKGNKATDWSPAPEDTTAEITSLSSKQSSLEQTINGFKATVESTYATNDSVTQKVSAVEQKADKISWLVKSGTSASSMELTSEALKIIADTEIKGDVIVGGVIKSSNYIANSTGMKLSLATGEWDSKYFKVSNTGTITATGGTIGGWNIENGITSTSSDNLMAVTIRPINVSGIPWLYVGKKAKASDTSWSYPFQLFPDGSAKCDSITINGSGKGLTSSLTDGSYSQDITINSGVFSMTCKNASSPNVYSATGSIHCGAIHRNIGGMFIDSVNGVVINKAVKIDPYGITFMYPDSESVKGNSIYFQTASDSGNNGRTPYVSVSSDGVFYVGSAKKTLYLSGTPINASRSITVVSDARMKNHIADLPSKSENLFDYLDGKSFFYNGDSSTAKNYGFIAQDVLSALQKCGLTTDAFAGFCDINGDGSQYALAYEQFVPIVWNEIKRLRKALSERS